MEQASNPEYSHLITPEEREELNRTLGHLGLVDAVLFDWPPNGVTEHPDDERWFGRGLE